MDLQPTERKRDRDSADEHPGGGQSWCGEGERAQRDTLARKDPEYGIVSGVIELVHKS